MQQLVLELDGLTTPRKAANLEKQLRQEFGDDSIVVDFVDATLIANAKDSYYESALITFVQRQGIRVLIEQGVFQADLDIIADIDAKTRAVIQKIMSNQPGLRNFFLDVASGHLRILHDSSVNPSSFVCALDKHNIASRLQNRVVKERLRNLRDYCAVVAALMLLMGCVLDSLTSVWQSWAIVPFFIAILAGIWPLLEDGVIGAFHKRKVNHASVILLLTMIANFYHMWFESALVVTMFSSAAFFERQFFRYIRTRIFALRQRLPANAYLLDNEKTVCECSSNVQPGQTLLVKAGEYVAVDGEITTGSASFRGFNKLERISGRLSKGDKVYAGWRLLEGEVQVSVTSSQQDSRWSVFLQGFHQSVNSVFPELERIRKVAIVFSAACFCAGLALLWAIYSPALNTGYSVSVALALLLISGPAAITSTIQGRALLTLIYLAERGVLVKQGVHFSRLANLRKLYFDKQGVITQGAAHVEEVISLSGESVKSLLQTARSLVPRNAHDYFRAVVQRARNEQLSRQAVEDLKQYGEQGFAGVLGGEQYLFGTFRLMKENGLVTQTINDRLERWQQDGVDVLFLANKHNIIGMFNVVDPLQNDIALSVDGLHALNVERLILLTEDNEISSGKLAYRMGFDSVKADLSQSDKSQILAHEDNRRFSAVVSSRESVLLSEGLLKFCVRALQRNKVYEVSDVGILGDSLELLPESVTVSSKTLMQLRNLTIVYFSYKLIMIGAILAMALPLWATILSELLFIYCMWLASTRHGVLHWINPANQPKSIMQLPPPRRQRIFSTGLIR
ncbi:MAG: HAD family hydrolase [Gammaproteobacteria bacterium]|nr:HAD family hydrolase [Gammaproteobacteria bacterium]